LADAIHVAAEVVSEIVMQLGGIALDLPLV
jgi:hypothetical protein